MRVLIAFDKFKDCMTAREACEIAARAVKDAHPDAQILQAPLSDGGEGFCQILTEARGGELQKHVVRGPLGEDREALLGFVALEDLDPGLREFLCVPDSGKLGIVEMAQASGLEHVPSAKRDPWKTSTFGTGELIRKAIDAGATAILLGIGGSATNDLGMGALQALGLRYLDEQGRSLDFLTPEQWPRIATFEGEPCDAPCIRIACDVTNPLLGPKGAAAVYGLQKGLQPEDLARMERWMHEMGQFLCSWFGESDKAMDEPSSGAAGGIGFGLRVACGARYVPGFELVWRWLALQSRLEHCDVLITGEGSFDASSLQGKGPGTLVRAASEFGKRVLIFCGRIAPDIEDQLPSHLGSESLHELSPRDLPIAQALEEGRDRLWNAVRGAV